MQFQCVALKQCFHVYNFYERYKIDDLSLMDEATDWLVNIFSVHIGHCSLHVHFASVVYG